MGRLPATFGVGPDGTPQNIKFRVPYNMDANIILTSAQTGIPYPDAAFQHSISMPFEIHRVLARIVALDSSSVQVTPQPAMDELLSLFQLTLYDTGKNQNLQRNAAFLIDLMKGSSERSWEWAEPYYLVKQEGFQAKLDAQTFPATFIDASPNMRVQLCFEGFLIVIAPPTANRGG